MRKSDFLTKTDSSLQKLHCSVYLCLQLLYMIEQSQHSNTYFFNHGNNKDTSLGNKKKQKKSNECSIDILVLIHHPLLLTSQRLGEIFINVLLRTFMTLNVHQLK